MVDEDSPQAEKEQAMNLNDRFGSEPISPNDYLYPCQTCGALVTVEAKERHNDWHEAILCTIYNAADGVCQ